MIFEQVQPKYGAICLAVSASIAHFTKRVQHVGRRRKLSASAKKFSALLLIASFGALLTACPKVKKTDVEKAFAYTERAANYTASAARVVGDLYRANAIDYETKEKIVARLKTVASGIVAFQESVKATRAAFGGEFPDKEINALDVMFNRDVLKPFVEILNETGVLSEKQSAQILSALAFLREAVLYIADFFGKLRPGQSASFDTYRKEVLLVNV